MSAVIELESLGVRFGERDILKNLTCSLQGRCKLCPPQFFRGIPLSGTACPFAAGGPPAHKRARARAGE